MERTARAILPATMASMMVFIVVPMARRFTDVVIALLDGAA